MQVGPEDDLTTYPLGFDASCNILYMADSRKRDTSALTQIDLVSGEELELATDSRADAADYIIHPNTRRVQAVGFEYDRLQWQTLDESISEDLNRIRNAADGDFHITSRSLDDRIWLIEYENDQNPNLFYIYDRVRGELSYLFSNRPQLEEFGLSPMKTATVAARDGLDLIVYYTLPMQRSSAEPPPAVLLVHGGPWGRDSWGYEPHHQLLSNRGYAVISVNFRGSTGFGKEFVNAGNREWGGKMHDDLLDVVEWAITCGIADRDRIAIMGGSYGGYATLVGMTFTPEVFACGVDIVGPSSLNTLLESVPPYWEPMIAMFQTRVGDNSSEEGRRFLESRSPISRADSIVRPLLIGQGANDPRVKQAESDQIVNAMTEHGIPVTYALYPDEGHGFGRPENSLSFMAVTEAFLAKHLGGRFEPIGSDFDGSSITIVAGADQIPNLDESS